MWEQFSKGLTKTRILPGSDTSSIPKPESVDYLSHLNPNYSECKDYVNTDTEEHTVKEKSNDAMPCSNMSSVDSITYTGSIADLQDLDMDQIKMFEHYKFKDSSHSSNNLFISQMREKIVQTINSGSTVLITGATGCGKSTQVPQFILDDCMARKKQCNIIVTQPRRIAAISVSKQVNKERGWKNGLIVGYQVGRKKDFDPQTTKILYCTTGILLQKIIKAKSLSEFTHIILDEVHERTLEMDFLLLIIKKLLKEKNQPTRIIMMSATANTYKLNDYFNTWYGPPLNMYVNPPQIHVSNDFNHTIIQHTLEDLYGFMPSAKRMQFNKPQIDDSGYETAICLLKEFDVIDTLSLSESSVLIFLPGIFEIEELHRRMEHIMTYGTHKWTLIPLHSSITSEEQDRVFEKPPLNHRKVILSTNISESSITVPDIAYVIDFCLMKQIKNELKSNYSMLLMSWASKSNCQQRAGRVGRVAAGRVYRLVPEEVYLNFDDHELPEMSRCSLSRVVLMSKLLDMGTPKQLLASALDPPVLHNIVLTVLTLKQVGALLPTVDGLFSQTDGDITYMGKVMAHLPLDPPMSKLIYFGHLFNILNEAIIMACGLSIKSIFSQPFNKRLDAYTQKLTWANYSCSDPIAYIGPYKSWLESKPEFDRNRNLERSWAKKNYIQLSGIRELYDLIDDVFYRLKNNFNIILNTGQMKWIKPEEKAMACKVILAGAFYPNYFIRGTSNSYMDEHHVLKTLNDHDPNRTVYFSGFPIDQPKELYKEAIENLFPSQFVGKPTAYFNNSNKIYIEFPMSNINNMSSNYNHNEKQLVPGNICFGVYVAIKMCQLQHDFQIPLLKPSDAKKKVELMFNQTTSQPILHQKILPIKRCIHEDIDPFIKTVNITVSHFESIDYFWVQLFDDLNKQKLIDIWHLVNDNLKLTSINESDLIINDFYIVLYNSENYRAKLINVLPGHQQKYKFLLVDFGESVELLIGNVFNIANENVENKIYNIPQFAFQCKIAKLRPAIYGKLETNNWSDKANMIFKQYGNYLNPLCGTIYSIVDGLVSFEDLVFKSQDKSVSIPKLLIENKLAYQSEDSFASKIDHDKRSHIWKTNTKFEKKLTTIHHNLKSPTVEEAYTMHSLKGPYSPLDMAVQGISRNNVIKVIKIEAQSVNSVLLDSNPNDYHERLFVAGNICMNENDRLTLWDSTMMPNIPGVPAIICLMFSPCVEIRYNASYTKMVGAICGLGYDPNTSKPLFQENDMEITFDTVMDHTFLNKINVIRMLLNKCVNPEDEEGPGDIFEIQHKLQTSLLKIFSFPTKFKAPEPWPRKYLWNTIPRSKLQSPYHENSLIDNPMAGSDVYKLLWGVKLSPKMSESECKELLHKLYKIKRLQDGFNFSNFSSGQSLEELICPLCQLVFSNSTSMRMHLNNYQHIERHKNAKDELHLFYTGPFSDIQNL